ncbi:hypothetical protein [Herbaspirillum sp. DW155]
MLENLLVTAERKAEQAERDKAAWVDKILMQREIQGQGRPVTG